MDIIIASRALKREIVRRVDQADLAFMRLCDGIKVDGQGIASGYLSNLSSDDHQEASQDDILKLCEALGIKIKVVLMLDGPVPQETIRLYKSNA